jgi:Ca2+-binding RTX toxin-like protein
VGLSRCLIENTSTGAIDGTVFGILSTYEAQEVRVGERLSAYVNDVILPFDSSLLFVENTSNGIPSIPVIDLPEIAAETGLPLLLPRFELKEDGLYHVVPWPDTFPAIYTRPDGSIATVDLEAGVIRDASGKILTLQDIPTWDFSSPLYQDSVTNAGTITGGMNLGIGDDTLINSGTITGAVLLESGRDSFNGRDGTTAVSVDGGAGIDTLSGGAANDTLTGGADNDTISGGGGADQLSGGAGSDTLNGGAGKDSMIGGTGADLYLVGVGDRITEAPNAGLDTVRSSVSFTLSANVESLTLLGTGNVSGAGNAASNSLSGNAGNNALDGRGGADNLKGAAGADTLIGGTGNDTLTGGAGSDALEGGDGADVFVFDTVPGTANADIVTDFSVGSDRIRLDDDVFTSLQLGSLAAPQFRAGAGLDTARDADDRILYNTTTGALFYDADGTGPLTPVHFATLGVATHPVLSAADFLIVT